MTTKTIASPLNKLLVAMLARESSAGKNPSDKHVVALEHGEGQISDCVVDTTQNNNRLVPFLNIIVGESIDY
jgi:hypothetical protein